MKRVPFSRLLAVVLFPVWVQAAEPEDIDWLNLLPPEDLAALEKLPESTEQEMMSEGPFCGEGAVHLTGQPAVLSSARTVASMNGKSVRLSGYPIPLEGDAEGRIQRFLLVSYPGACVQLPPPAPNQTVLVNYPQGINLDDVYLPLWVSGKLHAAKTSTELTDTAYTLDAVQVRLVEEAELEELPNR